MLLNLIKYQRLVIEKIYLFVKDKFESKFELLINGREEVGIKHEKYPKAFTDYSETMDDIYENPEDYNPTRKTNVNSD